METISGGPSEEFLPDTILQAAKLNKALENWVVTEVPDDTYGEIGDVVFVTGPGDGGSSSTAGGGKVLQVVRAVFPDVSETNNTSWEDANVSITITPTKVDSAILIIWNTAVASDGAGGSRVAHLQITDSSDNAISGAEDKYGAGMYFSLTQSWASRIVTTPTLIGLAAPAVTSPVTYKGRFRTSDASVKAEVKNNGQMYAIELADVAVSP